MSKLFQIKILFQIIIYLCLHPENELSHGFYLKIKVRQYMYYNFGSEYSKHVLTRNYYVDQVALNKFINDNVNNEANQANITDIVCHQRDVC